MYVLMMFITLFHPDWTEANGKTHSFITSSVVGEYQTLEECNSQERQMFESVGIYSKTYPRKNGYNVGVQYECQEAY